MALLQNARSTPAPAFGLALLVVAIVVLATIATVLFVGAGATSFEVTIDPADPLWAW